MDDHAFHRVDRLLPRLAREHLPRVGVAGLAARGDAGGREVDVLAVVVALELGGEEAHDVHGGAAAVAGVALDVGVAALLLGQVMQSLRMMWRRRWICLWRAMWLSARLAYWMFFWRPSTSQIDCGSGPAGCQTLTLKITESRRGWSSSPASIGVFE